MVIRSRLREILHKLKPKTLYTYMYSLPNGGEIHTTQSNLIEFASKREPSHLSLIDKKLNKTKHCYYIKLNGEIAHVSWVFSKNLLARQLGFNKYLVIGDCLTSEKYKGRGLYGQTVGYIINKYPKKKFILFIEPNNIASIKGVEKIGLTPLGLYTVKRVLGIAYYIKRNG